MFNKYKNKSISERICENFNQNPDDVEIISENEETPKVAHFNEDDYDVGNEESIRSVSEIRKKHVKLLSEQSSKYRGVITSRKDYNSDDEDEEDSCQLKKPQIIEFNSVDSIINQNRDNFEEVNDILSGKDEISERELLTSKNEKKEKGVCVQNQLCIWEKLLEIRIQSQKMLNNANSLPAPDIFEKFNDDIRFKDTAKEVQINTERLLEKLIEAQVTLANQFSEIQKAEGRKRTHPRSDDICNPSSTSYSKKIAPTLEENFAKFRPYRNAVLLKWEDRTKFLASSSEGSKRKQRTEELNIVQKVDSALIKLKDHIAKSQKLKGTYKLFSQNHGAAKIDDETDENKKEIISPHNYDDTDFYHSQLRELIEFKSNISSDAYDVTKQLAELQKLRQRMKKKVDVRASKGRKLRYIVHQKLVNFMAPKDASAWTDESKNELYRSLFVT